MDQAFSNAGNPAQEDTITFLSSGRFLTVNNAGHPGSCRPAVAILKNGNTISHTHEASARTGETVEEIQQEFPDAEILWSGSVNDIEWQGSQDEYEVNHMDQGMFAHLCELRANRASKDLG